MFYRWARRLEAMQFPATAFPAAGGDSVVEAEEAHQLDGAVVAAAIGSLWVLMLVSSSKSFVTADWAVATYAPIFLVAVLGALFVRPSARIWVIAAHLAVYLGLAAVIGGVWATSAFQAIVWGAFFALLGLVTTVLCLVVWAVALNQLVTPGTALYRYATQFRVGCVALILMAALFGLSKAITIPLIALR